MEALSSESVSYRVFEPKWRNMFVVSLVLHLGLFSVIFFVPESFPTRRMQGVIYEVDLVEMPRAKTVRSKKRGTVKSKTGLKKATPTKLIRNVAKKDKPVVIAKRTLKRKVKKSKKSSPAKLIDQALSRIEKKVKLEEKDPIKQALSKIEKRVKDEGSKGLPGAIPQDGITIRMYKMEVEDRIKSNWAYPVALLSPESRKGLEAIVVVKVKNNGAILNSWFTKKSSSPGFDQSVMRAIERSDPLPSFPPGYRKTHDEIEIYFNLKELEG
jgi:colicin import membrane protein